VTKGTNEKETLSVRTGLTADPDAVVLPLPDGAGNPGDETASVFIRP
jgi:hypothetical protein